MLTTTTSAPLGTARVGNEVEVLLQALQTLEEPFDVNLAIVLEHRRDIEDRKSVV